MSLADLRHLVADGLIVLGSLVMTIGVIGIYRMPDVYTKLHAASKSVFLGVCSFLVAIVDTGDAAIIARAVLIGLLLLLTTPVSAYENARAAAREEWLRANAPPATVSSAARYAGRRAT
jgi:multicomponent Na+:H+ antiporter subunit G